MPIKNLVSNFKEKIGYNTLKSTDKIRVLSDYLNEQRNAYYNNNQSIISDQEYDMLFDELKLLEYETGYILSSSPTQSVGYEVKSKLSKVQHNHPMLSLNKTKSENEVIEYFKGRKLVAMPKMDGLTVSIRYLNGELISAETRGDGEIGEDILHTAITFVNLPINIDFKDELIIDGEAVITFDDFESINKILPEEEKYKHPRNLASGSVRQLDSSISAQRHIKFIAWKLIKGMNNNSFTERLSFLRDLGFEVVNGFNGMFNSEDSLITRIEWLKKVTANNNYPIDGLVFTFDDIEYGESLGATSHHPKHSLAFKFEDEETLTKLKYIDWTMGKTGVLTPTAVFEAIEIDGTTVDRASVHNVSILKSLNLHIGDTISVYKANNIIPQIKENKTVQQQDFVLNNLEIPKICPICNQNTNIIKEKETEVLWCTNESCKGKLLGRMNHFVSKNAMNIEGLSEATLEKFIDRGYLLQLEDIYNLNNFRNEIEKLEGFGKKSCNKLFESIEKSKHTTLDRFIYSLSIPLIGRTASKTISNFFNGDFNEFYESLWEFDWQTLNDFGKTMCDSMRNFIKNNGDIKINSIALHLNFQNNSSQVMHQEQKLKDLTFVITGSLNNFENRDKLKEEIECVGGKVLGSVSKKTNYLINNDTKSISGKNKKAKELGVKIISENEFLEMIR